MADANWSKYTALFRLRGGVGGTSFPDVRGEVSLDANSGCSITTGINNPFGSNVGVLNKPAGSSYLKNSSALSALKCGTGDFSLGGWFYITRIYSGGQGLFGFGTPSVSSGFFVRANITDTVIPYPGSFDLYYNGSTVCSINKSSGMPINAWAHINVSRSSGLLKLHINGIGSSTTSATDAFNEGVLILGNNIWAESSGMGGYVSEFYMCNGQCLYWDDFVSPIAPTVAPTLSGTVRNANNALVARTVRAYLRATGVLKGEVVSSETSGAFSMEVPDMASHTIIALDDGAPDENAQIFDNVTPI